MTSLLTLHQLIDDIDSQYTSQINTLTHKLNDAELNFSGLLKQKEQSFNEETLRFQSVEKQYKSTICDLENKLDKIKTELFSCKTQSEQDFQSFKSVSILNQYLKEIEQLKNENSILNRRLDSSKKLLEQSQKENKYFKELKKDLISTRDSISQTAEDSSESEESEESEEAEEAQEAEEIDISKLDIIEVDNVEYYLDLDNNIRDKDSLEVVGTITEEGDAIFNS